MKIKAEDINKLLISLPSMVNMAVESNSMMMTVPFIDDVQVQLMFSVSRDSIVGERKYVKVYLNNYRLLAEGVVELDRCLTEEKLPLYQAKIIGHMHAAYVSEFACILDGGIRHAPDGKTIDLGNGVLLIKNEDTVTIDHNGVIATLNKKYFPGWSKVLAQAAATVIVDVDDQRGEYNIPTGGSTISDAFTQGQR